MSAKEFNKAVNTTPIEGLKQPERFMNNESQTQTQTQSKYDSYLEKQKYQQTNVEQEIFSVAVEPIIKELIQQAGKKLGRTKGGVKAIAREAYMDYLKKHKKDFE